MGVFQNNLLAASAAAASAGGGPFYSHQIEQSVRLPRSTTSNGGANGGGFYRNSSATITDSKKWAFSFWLKKGAANLNLSQNIILTIVSGGGRNIYVDDNNSSEYDKISSNGVWGSYSYAYPPAFRDTNGWYHYAFIFDTTQSAQADRQKVYVNGTLLGVGDTTNNWSLNQSVWWNSSFSGTYYQSIGYNAYGHSEGNSYGVYGYLAEVIAVDGQDVAISDFGETKNGVWIPKQYTGSFGGNGYHLKFENASDLGNDSSGNNNDFLTTNLGTDHQVLDSPTNGEGS